MERYTVWGVREDGRIVRDVVQAERAELAPLMMRVDGTGQEGGDWRVVAVFEGDVDDELRLEDTVTAAGVPLVVSYRAKLAQRNREEQMRRDVMVGRTVAA